MLTKVRFKNFKSFVNEVVINLEPTKSEILKDTNIYNDVLKGCCFYGSNASGKTNALNAITLLLDMLFKNIVNNVQLITIFNNEPYMYFEYTFLIDNKEIVYYFEISREWKILKETLTIDGINKMCRLVNSCESFITDKKDYGKDDVNENILFLRTIYFNTGFSGYDELIHWFDFLKNSLYINFAKGKIVNPREENDNIKAYLENYLNKYGTDDINAFFTEFNFPYSIDYIKTQMLESSIFSTFDTRLKFVRQNMADIPYFMESAGNMILIKILPAILTIVKTGGILAIDEFSSGLHNKLEELLIEYVFKHSKNCQLLFVSHSTNLLKTSLLRPDQIYSVDFDEHGSFLRKFSDEKPRGSQNLEKMYLSGVFGGLPLYGKNQD